MTVSEREFNMEKRRIAARYAKIRHAIKWFGRGMLFGMAVQFCAWIIFEWWWFYLTTH